MQTSETNTQCCREHRRQYQTFVHMYVLKTLTSKNVTGGIISHIALPDVPITKALCQWMGFGGKAQWPAKYAELMKYLQLSTSQIVYILVLNTFCIHGAKVSLYWGFKSCLCFNCVILVQGDGVSEQTMIKGGGTLYPERAKKYFFVTLPFM